MPFRGETWPSTWPAFWFLPDRAHHLLTLRYGLAQKPGMSIVELARRFAVTEARIRNNIDVALGHLFDPEHLSKSWNKEIARQVVVTIPRSFEPDHKALLRAWPALAWLTPRQEQALRLRYGLDGQRPFSLREVGAFFMLTGGWAQQYLGAIERKLHEPSWYQGIEAFMQQEDSSAR